MGDDVYLKMYISAARDGLIADMGDSRWRTLCVIASFMDDEGRCWPSQDQIARRLGVTRQAASKRVRNLLDYRWKGQPVLVSEKTRTCDGTWNNNVYTVLPNSLLSIF